IGSQKPLLDLKEDGPELLGGDVVEQWVHDGAEVEESVCDGEEGDVHSEVGDGPVLLRSSSTNGQSCNNQSCNSQWHKGLNHCASRTAD
uniref:Uncharacterized protein n=1 Tax=Anolis carolinensis TaxID=28377 RepID=A0A803SUM3_ANOCA